MGGGGGGVKSSSADSDDTDDTVLSLAESVRKKNSFKLGIRLFRYRREREPIRVPIGPSAMVLIRGPSPPFWGPSCPTLAVGGLRNLAGSCVRQGVGEKWRK